MSSQNYESGKLNSILESLLTKKISGILSLKTQVSHWHSQRSCILMVSDGALVYGDINISQIPNNRDVCQTLGEKLKPDLINAALSVAVEKSNNSTSFRKMMEFLIKMRVFTWQRAEEFVTNQTVLILEQFLSHPGKARWQKNDDIDLKYGEDSHGLDWLNIKREIDRRRQKWHEYAPIIPCMDAIPFVTTEQLTKIGDRNVQQHLTSSANGQNTLLDIADKIGKDPLKVAKSYTNWANNGWVNLGTRAKNRVENPEVKIQSPPRKTAKQSIPPASNTTNQGLPIVLSVDDSAIIQVSIKRALQEQYQVVLATKAADALKILNEQPVELLLLDLTMPDIDGLEFCKMVRRIDKLQDLPIVMVTARDGLVNKMKGHIAGSSKYLTKPFKPEQLREVVGEYFNK